MPQPKQTNGVIRSYCNADRNPIRFFTRRSIALPCDCFHLPSSARWLFVPCLFISTARTMRWNDGSSYFLSINITPSVLMNDPSFVRGENSHLVSQLIIMSIHRSTDRRVGKEWFR